MMGRQTIALLALILCWLAIVWILSPSQSHAMEPAAQVGSQRPFVVFDGTLYKNKPSLAPYHVRPITLLYEYRLFGANQSPDAIPSEAIVRPLAQGLHSSMEPVVLDIERWPLRGDDHVVQSSVAKFLSVLAWVKAEAPNVEFGFYGTVPIPDYWRAIRDPTSAEFRSWQQDNDRLDGISDRIDALFPSIYTFYPDRQGWVNYAIAQIAEARRKAKGKPVYAFLMPLYHESNRLLGLHQVDQDYWELQLNTVAQHADGLVIWGGWGTSGPEPWDEEAPWWQVTKRFMKRFDQVVPGTPSGLKVH